MSVVEYAEVSVAELQPYGLNPRQGDIGAISVSLEANGQYRPIVVNRSDNTILAGNHTYHAAVALGWEKIQVGYVDVDEATAQRIVLVDNRTNDLADYDQNVLADLLELVINESGSGGLVGTGFDADDMETILTGGVDFNTLKDTSDRTLTRQPMDIRCPNCDHLFEV